MYNLQQLINQLNMYKSSLNTIQYPPRTVEEQHRYNSLAGQIQQLENLIKTEQYKMQVAQQQQQYIQPQVYQQQAMYQQPTYAQAPQYPTQATYPQMGIAANLQNTVGMVYTNTNAAVENTGNDFGASKIPVPGNTQQQVQPQPVTPVVQDFNPNFDPQRNIEPAYRTPANPELDHDIEPICPSGYKAVRVDNYTKGTYAWELKVEDNEKVNNNLNIFAEQLDITIEDFSDNTIDKVMSMVNDVNGIAVCRTYLPKVIKKHDKKELEYDEEIVLDTINGCRNTINNLSLKNMKDLIQYVSRFKELYVFITGCATSEFNLSAKYSNKENLTVDNFLNDFYDLMNYIDGLTIPNSIDMHYDILSDTIKAIKNIVIPDDIDLKADSFTIYEKGIAMIVKSDKLYKQIRLPSSGVGILRQEAYPELFKVVDSLYRSDESNNKVLRLYNTIGCSKTIAIVKREKSYVLMDVKSKVYLDAVPDRDDGRKEYTADNRKLIYNN